MMLLHFLQRILKTLPRTFSSAIEYLAEQASQTIFIVVPRRRAVSRSRPPAKNCRMSIGKKRDSSQLDHLEPARRNSVGAFFQPAKGSRRTIVSDRSAP